MDHNDKATELNEFLFWRMKHGWSWTSLGWSLEPDFTILTTQFTTDHHAPSIEMSRRVFLKQLNAGEEPAKRAWAMIRKHNLGHYIELVGMRGDTT